MPPPQPVLPVPQPAPTVPPAASTLPPPRQAPPSATNTGAQNRSSAHRDSTSASTLDRTPDGAAAYETAIDLRLLADQAAAYGPRPRPGRRARGPARTVVAVVCAVLGIGLLAGAVLGSWFSRDSDGARTADEFEHARTLWRSAPVDTLFPRTLRGPGAGPGGADRTWTRIAVAPDSRCEGAFDPLLATALSPVGCQRLLRATYTDATSTSVTTVGLVITRSNAAKMQTLKERFRAERLGQRGDLLPRSYAAEGTVAEDFGEAQRASWRLSVRTDLPLIVYAVTGFADGRSIRKPEPADRAAARGATTDPAQAGLGHDARGIAAGVERAFRKAVGTAVQGER
ncbi:hypothetical protein [Streptomyces zagrosensis]|uniref:Uncharacterized protein n=1 Tax=Streptomyces zagrosensis TaxID=1042984 RepID=A0A7W9QFP9_9ACTN|nr:hypothetical protein [Streptomyces zagrosensis]MBB5938878.1 hypothetical protein [Streptomyces zagrosensis]